jgi:hypothetical protein
MAQTRIVIKRALQGETVEIQWTLADGTIYYERYTCPPKATREVRLARRLAMTDTLPPDSHLPPDRRDRVPTEEVR